MHTPTQDGTHSTVYKFLLAYLRIMAAIAAAKGMDERTSKEDKITAPRRTSAAHLPP